MIKYLALTVMLASPISAAALTAEQELSQKCELRMVARVKNVKGKTLYQDKRICGCVAEEIKKKVPADKLQETADFYTEKYETTAAKDPAKNLSVPHISAQCVLKFYKKEQVIEEGKKISEANKAYAAEKKLEQEKKLAEHKRRVAAKVELDRRAKEKAKKSSTQVPNQTPIKAAPAKKVETKQPAAATKTN